MLNKLAVSLVFVVLMSGCVSMESVMTSWMGGSIDDVTASWGAPDSRIPRQDGGYTYTWTTFSSSEYGVNQCRQTFVTDENGRIFSWSYNGCPKYIYK